MTTSHSPSVRSGRNTVGSFLLAKEPEGDVEHDSHRAHDTYDR